jgi:ubiquinone/menaquinone biosynthesis C-methylase UbiE
VRIIHEKSYVPALGFHVLTPAYDAVVRLTTRERTFKSALIQQAGISNGQRVLDLACGTGTLAIAMTRLCPSAEILGIDGDEAMLEIARRKTRAADADIQFNQGLSFALPYPECHFDRITSSLFFHHLTWPDKVRTAAELHRVLRPGGELHVADWGRATGLLMRAAFLGVQLLDGFANTRDNVAGRLPELFAGAGFHDVVATRTFTTALGTISLYRAVKA